MLDIFEFPSKDSWSDVFSCPSSTDFELSNVAKLPRVAYHSSENVEINWDIAEAQFSTEFEASVYSNLVVALSSLSIGPNNPINSNSEFKGLTHVCSLKHGPNVNLCIWMNWTKYSCSLTQNVGFVRTKPSGLIWLVSLLKTLSALERSNFLSRSHQSHNFQIWGANTCAIMAKPRTCLRPSERQRVP